ncbi:MAG: DNA-formamidopyrimidine glycosylase [Bacillota bacterium]
MPELPEVETVRRTLLANIIDKKISKVSLYYQGNIRSPKPDLFCELLKNKIFRDIQRRGKFLIFYLSSGLVLIVHLRMTGQLVYLDSRKSLEKHTHLVFSLQGGMDLRYLDIRKFGTFDLLKEEELESFKSLQQLGLEPLSSSFSSQKFKEKARGRGKNLKALLLDQSTVAGIGNIYADEILFKVGFHPEMSTKNLTELNLEQLHRSIVDVLKLGVRYRGTTFRNYVDGEGKYGQFQDLLNVYGRKGEPCFRCGAEIRKTRVAGRGTYYCPQCQPNP